MDLSQSFFKTAKSDLRVANLLYENNEFSHAIFNLQQAVEKISKAFGLQTKIIKAEGKDIRKISHEPKRVFDRVVCTQQELYEKLVEVNKTSPNLLNFNIEEKDINVIEYFEETEDLRKSFLDLHSRDFEYLSTEDIDEMLSKISELNIKEDIDVESLHNYFNTNIKSLINQLETKTGVDLEGIRDFFNDQNIKKELPGFFKQYAILAVKSLYISATLLFLSLITSSHNQPSRYPCTCCGEIPENNYDKDAAIVMRFPEIYSTMRIAFDYFEEILMPD